MRENENIVSFQLRAMKEATVRPAGEEFAVVLGRQEAIAIVTASAVPPDWFMSFGEPSHKPLVDRKLISAVRGIRAGILAVAWVKIDPDGQRVDLLCEDLATGDAELRWTPQRNSPHWHGGPTTGLL